MAISDYQTLMLPVSQACCKRGAAQPIAASIAFGTKTCRRREPLVAGMIGRQGVFQIEDGPKRTALGNLETAGAQQQAHN
jgi:hypothetical protein